MASRHHLTEMGLKKAQMKVYFVPRRFGDIRRQYNKGVYTRTERLVITLLFLLRTATG